MTQLSRLVSFCCVLAFMAMQSASAASTGDWNLGHPCINHHDQASLQRGARIFMNYCSGCHSMQYLRYTRMAKDIGITDGEGRVLLSLLERTLMFTSDKATDPILSALSKRDATDWFGVQPPDMSLETRLRGSDWVYQYLLAFYVDEKQPWGVNNLLIKNVAMPNVLESLQGIQHPVFANSTVNSEHTAITGLKLVSKGQLSQTEFNDFVNDLVNFMSYAADPVKTERETLGVFVILFLVILLGFSYLLKREYWKDIH